MHSGPHLELLQGDKLYWDRYPLIVNEQATKHERLSHYCNVDTLNYILSGMSLKGTPLSSGRLNDQYESKRLGIEDYADYCYIICFTHCLHEIVSFWMNYGGKDKSEKLLLGFKNFSLNPSCFINIDYIFLNKYKRIKLGNNVICLRINDVEYRPINDDVFTRPNRALIMSSDGIHELAFPVVLGKYKTEHWDYEKETRIVLLMNNRSNNRFNEVYFQLKQEIFRDLNITLSPWASDKAKERLSTLLDKCMLPEDIRKSILIKESELSGQIYYDS